MSVGVVWKSYSPLALFSEISPTAHTFSHFSFANRSLRPTLNYVPSMITSLTAGAF